MGTTPSSTTRGRRRARELRLQPGTKNWLLLNDEFLMGPRYVALLEGVDQLGSIRAACGRAGVSYRTAMNRVRQMERVLGTPVLRTRRGGVSGGGATLTVEARAIVQVFRDWRAELLKLSDAAFRRAVGRADLKIGR
ncbi:MAG: winged helix-turn-helix domain-containing protein [Gemmatimonadales bacterium]